MSYFKLQKNKQRLARLYRQFDALQEIKAQAEMELDRISSQISVCREIISELEREREIRVPELIKMEII